MDVFKSILTFNRTHFLSWKAVIFFFIGFLNATHVPTGFTWIMKRKWVDTEVQETKKLLSRRVNHEYCYIQTQIKNTNTSARLQCWSWVVFKKENFKITNHTLNYNIAKTKNKYILNKITIWLFSYIVLPCVQVQF